MFLKNIRNTKYEILNTKEGFTILEITIVVFIIIVGMMGVLSLVNQNIQVEYINKNMIAASQLSQEGLEMVRNKRDINWLREVDWKHGTTSAFNIIQDGSYAIDHTGVIDAAPSGITDAGARLYIDSDGFYTNSVTDTPTIFSRLITVDAESSASTTFTCLVQWTKGTNAYNFSAQTVLYDWR